VSDAATPLLAADGRPARMRFSLVTGEFFVNLSRGAMTLSLGYFFYRLTNSVWAFALACLAELGMTLVLRRASGRLVEAWGARPALVTAGAALALVLCAVSLAGDLYAYSVWLALAVALLLSVIRVVQSAAGYAAVVIYAAGRVEATNSLISIALQTGQLAGVLIAGVTLELLSLNMLCLFAGLSYLAATACYALLPHAGAKPLPAGAARAAHDDTERIPPALKLYAVLAALDFGLCGVFNLLLAPAVAAAFGNSPRWMSILDVNFAVGAIVAGFVLVRFTAFSRARRWLPSLLSIGSGILCFVALFHFKGAPLFLLVFLFGFASTASYMFWTSVSQMETEARLSGRVGAFKSVCNSLALALAAILLTAATVADRQLILAAAVVAGMLSTACAVAMLLKLRGAARA
jgi:predicted MFS family arabinose efflux permease